MLWIVTLAVTSLSPRFIPGKTLNPSILVNMLIVLRVIQAPQLCLLDGLQFEVIMKLTNGTNKIFLHLKFSDRSQNNKNNTESIDSSKPKMKQCLNVLIRQVMRIEILMVMRTLMLFISLLHLLFSKYK